MSCRCNNAKEIFNLLTCISDSKKEQQANIRLHAAGIDVTVQSQTRTLQSQSCHTPDAGPASDVYRQSTRRRRHDSVPTQSDGAAVSNGHVRKGFGNAGLREAASGGAVAWLAAVVVSTRLFLCGCCW